MLLGLLCDHALWCGYYLMMEFIKSTFKTSFSEFKLNVNLFFFFFFTNPSMGVSGFNPQRNSSSHRSLVCIRDALFKVFVLSHVSQGWISVIRL